MSARNLARVCALLSAAAVFGGIVPSLGAQAQLEGEWTTATRLNDASLNGYSTRVSVAEDGGALVVWLDVEGGRNMLRSRSFSPDSGWLPITTVWSGVPNTLQNTLRLAGNGAGDAVAAWYYNNGTQWFVGAAHFVHDWGWSLARPVSSTGNVYGPSWDPGVSIGERGDALVTWVTDIPAMRAMAARFVPGIGWTSEQHVANLTNGSAFDVAAAIDASGVATAIWGENNGTDETLWASRSTNETAWGPAELVFEHPDNGPTVVWTGVVQFSATSGGEVVGVWEAYDGQTSRTSIWQAAYDGAWTAAPLSDPSVNSMLPRLALAPDGTAATAYWQNGTIVLRTRAPLSAWGPTLNASTTLPPSADTAVAVGRSGDAVVLWREFVAPRSVLVSRFYSSATGWGNVTRIDALTPYQAGYLPGAGIDSAGNAFAVFEFENANASLSMPSAARFNAADGSPPPLEVSSPADGASTGSPLVWVSGSTESGARLWVNGVEAAVADNGSFGLYVSLAAGTNAVEVRAADGAGNEARWVATVTFVDPLPPLAAAGNATQAELDAARADLTAAQARLAALEASKTALESDLAAAESDLEAARVRLAALESQQAANAQRAENASASQAELAARMGGLSTLATVALVAALAAVGLAVVLARRSGRGSDGPKP